MRLVIPTPFVWQYVEIRLPTSDCLSESLDRVPPQIISNRTIWCIVDRHADWPRENRAGLGRSNQVARSYIRWASNVQGSDGQSPIIRSPNS